MTDSGWNRACAGIVLVTALTSGANLILTIRQTNLMKERAAKYEAVRMLTEARLARIEGKLDALDADLDTHNAIMDDIEVLKSQVRALRAGSK